MMAKSFASASKENKVTTVAGDDIRSITISKPLGTHEVQECLKGQCEADLHTHLANCKKNPGHTGFIPVKKFRKEHLPPGYQDSDVYDVINAQSYVTVRIAVKFTSKNRPEFELGTKRPYPCYKTRGKKLMRTGTGKIAAVKKNSDDSDEPCPCPECKHSTKPKKKWFKVWVQTARHVIFDSEEARQSRCRLWFDDDQSPVVNIYGWRAGGISHTGQDWCILFCVTHEPEIAEKLLNVIRRYSEIWGKVNSKYISSRDVDKLTIIVSHPHGCSKLVSVGHWVDREPVGSYTRYTYTTCTCPGSSGAGVYKLEWTDHPHSGAHANGFNYSAAMSDLDFSFTGEDLELKRQLENNNFFEMCDSILASTDDSLQYRIK
ncbi:uncharacterized protein LOC131942347 isoform X2 [Physella acuta]|uniref:uncharacterized protein LOC131942347 isoform X2 n=1 Tax=Physella acuta TaxID=109671 RepID=UPI0027DEA3D2|nr:uncharacterized protein LOC131942347 isoform X2 [Physella acuta]